MRILFTADPELPVPPGLYGGIERLVDLWIREARIRGHTVALVGRRDSTASVDQFFPWPGARSQNAADTWRNALALWRAAKVFRADVVHSSSRLAYTLPLLFSRIPVVQTYHRFPGPRQIRIAARLGGRRLAFTGISQFITGLGRAGGGNWHTVPNCIDLKVLTFQSTVPADAPLVFLSRIEEVKGAREAIAMARATGRQFLLAGNHGSDSAAKRYWHEHIEPELDDQIRYLGAVDDVRKSSLLGSAAALLVPVQWNEPFGLVFAEALACGTPAISCPRGGVPEIINPGVTGFLVGSVEEGIAAIGRIGEINRTTCRRSAEEKFSSEAALASFEAIYRKVAHE